MGGRKKGEKGEKERRIEEGIGEAFRVFRK